MKRNMAWIAGVTAMTLMMSSLGSGAVYAESAVSEAEGTEAAAVSEAAESETAESEVEETEASESADDSAVSVSRIHFAADWDEVYQALRDATPYYYYDEYIVEDAEDLDYGAAAEGAVSSNSTASAARAESAMDGDVLVGGTDYSETNVRTEGVDEADIVKTDGRYIYVLRKHTDLEIVRADGGSMTPVSSIHINDGTDWYSGGGQEFFVSGNHLYILSVESANRESGYWYGSYGRETHVLSYDISDPASPVKTGEMVQDGSYLQARMVDGVVYVFTEWRPNLSSTLEDSSIRPKVAGEEVLPEAICIPNIVTDANYLIVSAVNPDRPSEVTDAKILVSGAQQLYVSGEALYAMNVDYRQNKERTEIVRFLYGNGSITGKAAGTVRGYVNDTFSIDEYDGYIRVLTTYTGSLRGHFLEVLSDLFGFDYDSEDRWIRHNALFVLDDSMHQVSRIVDLAAGEDIRSARFLGNIGYFVTFRNTDPLFTVDLTDPKAPKITDKLKVPGFSSYLHPFGESALLGIGYDADEYTGQTSGLKLSVFDISDPNSVVESDRTVVPNITWLSALQDYKAIFADAGKQLVGFYLEDRYMVYHRTEGGTFERVLLYDLFEDNLQGLSDENGLRGLYIGDTFYLAGNPGIVAFDLADGFAKIGVLSF